MGGTAPPRLRRIIFESEIPPKSKEVKRGGKGSAKGKREEKKFGFSNHEVRRQSKLTLVTQVRVRGRANNQKLFTAERIGSAPSAGGRETLCETANHT